jgi:hypothetical protein
MELHVAKIIIMLLDVVKQHVRFMNLFVSLNPSIDEKKRLDKKGMPDDIPFFIS